MASIREIHESDAEEFLELCRRLDEETHFMMLEPGERLTTGEEQRERIRHLLSRDNQTILVAEHGDRLVGYLSALGGEYRRDRHSAHIVVGILREFAGRGVGTQLFSEMEDWARRRSIHRLELTVMAICCKSEFPIVAEEIPQALGGEFWLPPHERVPHSVALSVKDQQVAVVHEAVDQSRGHGLVEEDIHPPAELQVCGDEHAAFLVAG
jgi:GNAT superfamily N-acetyltransferase